MWSLKMESGNGLCSLDDVLVVSLPATLGLGTGYCSSLLGLQLGLL